MLTERMFSRSLTSAFSGRTASTLAWALVCWSLLSSVDVSRTSDPVNFQTLSGVWVGKEESSQTGECAIRFAYRHHDTFRIQLILDVARDGSFTVVKEMKHKDGVSPNKWLGQLNSDLTFTVSQPVHAKCDGVERDYKIIFIGQIVSKPDQLEIEMQGIDATCPEMRCEFKEIIHAKKQ